MSLVALGSMLDDGVDDDDDDDSPLLESAGLKMGSPFLQVPSVAWHLKIKSKAFLISLILVVAGIPAASLMMPQSNERENRDLVAS